MQVNQIIVNGIDVNEVVAERDRLRVELKQARDAIALSRLASVTGALEDALHKRTDALRRIRALPCNCAATFKDGSHLSDCVKRSIAVSIAREVLGGEP